MWSLQRCLIQEFSLSLQKLLTNGTLVDSKKPAERLSCLCIGCIMFADCEHYVCRLCTLCLSLTVMPSLHPPSSNFSFTGKSLRRNRPNSLWPPTSSSMVGGKVVPSRSNTHEMRDFCPWRRNSVSLYSGRNSPEWPDSTRKYTALMGTENRDNGVRISARYFLLCHFDYCTKNMKINVFIADRSTVNSSILQDFYFLSGVMLYLPKWYVAKL